MSPNTTLCWVCDGLSKSSDVMTSVALLNYMALLLFGFLENIGGVLLALRVLRE
jgi:hypothetical protein